ncbi:MAG: hypothetical protein PHW00_01420, partial [Clostridia bacterium]|nr:hypothetical protein [Clostridia bacterium]
EDLCADYSSLLVGLPVLDTLLGIAPYDDILAVVLSDATDKLDAILHNVFEDVTIGDLIGSTYDWVGEQAIIRLFTDKNVYTIISYSMNGEWKPLAEYMLSDITIGSLFEGLYDLSTVPVVGAFYSKVLYTMVSYALDAQWIELVLYVLDGITLDDLFNGLFTMSTTPIAKVFAYRELGEIATRLFNSQYLEIADYMVGGVELGELLDGFGTFDATTIIGLNAFLEVMPYDDIVKVIINGGQFSTIMNNVFKEKTINSILGIDLSAVPVIGQYANTPVVNVPIPILVIGGVGGIAFVVFYFIIPDMSIGKMLGYTYDETNDVYYADSAMTTVAPSYLEAFAHIIVKDVLDYAMGADFDGMLLYIFDDATIGSVLNDQWSQTTTPVLKAFADRQLYEIASRILGTAWGSLVEYMLGSVTIRGALDGIVAVETIPVVGAFSEKSLYTIYTHIIGNNFTALLEYLLSETTFDELLLGVVDMNANAITRVIAYRDVYQALSKLMAGDMQGLVSYLIGDAHLGDLLGKYTDGTYWYTDSTMTTLVGPRDAVLSRVVVSQLLDPLFASDIMGALEIICGTQEDNVRVGDILDYTYDDATDTWSKADGTAADSLLSAIAPFQLYRIFAEGFKATDIVADAYLGSIMGFTKGTQTGGCEPDCSIEHEHEKAEYEWTNSNGDTVSGIELRLANTKMDQLVGGTFDIEGILGDMYLGEIMNYTKGDLDLDYCTDTDVDGVCDNTDSAHTHKYVWLNGSEPVTGITKYLANVQMSSLLGGTFDIEGILGDMYLGEAMNYAKGDLDLDHCTDADSDGACDNTDPTHSHRYIWWNGATQVSGITKYLANAQMSSILGGSFDVVDIIGDMYLGEAMNYTYNEVEDAWYQGSTPVTAINNAIAGVLMSDILSGTFDVNSTIGGLYLGEIMNYTKGDLDLDHCTDADIDGVCDNTDPEHAHRYTWWNGASEVTGITKYLANAQMSSILGGSFDVIDIIGDMQLGEAMGYTYNDVESKWYSGATPVTAINNAIAGVLMSEILSGAFNINGTIGDLYLGEVMDYTKGDLDLDHCTDADADNVCDNTDLTHAHRYIWWNGASEVTGITKYLANAKMSSLLGGDFNINSIIGDMQLGEVMGYTYDTVEGVWMSGTPLAPVSAINNALADVLMSDILSGTFDINGTIGHLKLGEVMGYTYDTVEGVWMSGTPLAPVSAINNALADVLMSDILSGTFDINGTIGHLKLGEVMGYTYDTVEDAWMSGTPLAPVSAINNALADVLMSDILSGSFDVNTVIGDLQLGDVMNYVKGDLDLDHCTDVDADDVCDNTNPAHTHWYTWYEGTTPVTSINNALANVMMSSLLSGNFNINDVIGDMYIGEVMGYEIRPLTIDLTDLDKCAADCAGVHTHDYEWLSGGVAVDEVSNMISNETMNNLLNGNINFQDKIQNLTLGDVIDCSGNTMLELLADTKVGELGTKADTLMIGELMGMNKYYVGMTSKPVAYSIWITDDIFQNASGEYVVSIDGLWYYATISAGADNTVVGNYTLTNDNEIIWREEITDTAGYAQFGAGADIMIDTLIINHTDGKWYEASYSGGQYIKSGTVEIDSITGYGNVDVTGTSNVYGTVRALMIMRDTADNTWYKAMYDNNTSEYVYLNLDSLTRIMADTSVGNMDTINTKLTNWISNEATVKTLMDMGILNFNQSTMEKLDALFCQDGDGSAHLGAYVAHMPYTCPTATADRAAWSDMTLPDFINAVISSIG